MATKNGAFFSVTNGLLIWTELSKAIFTYDNTAAKGYHMDFTGGLANEQFFLKNCGFFPDYTTYRSTFSREGEVRVSGL